MGVMIVGGGVGLVPVLMDLVQTPDETREMIKSWLLQYGQHLV